jgi:DnaJ-domain-containing protein 1
VILAILLAAGLAWWLHREGALLPNLRRFGVAAGAAIIALRLLETGNIPAAAAVAGGGIWWWIASRPKPLAVADLADARAVLGVSPTDDAAAIDAAWRRLIAQVHPDKGGSADLARRVTAARDLLLARGR